MGSSIKRFLNILLSLALFIGAVVVFTNYIRPTLEEAGGINELRAKRNSKVLTLKNAQSQVDAYKNLNIQYQDNAKYRPILDSSLPSDANVPLVLAQIQGLASANKLNLGGISFQYLPLQSGQAKTKPYGTLRMALKVDGTYPNLKSFLLDLESNLRIMDVVSIKLSSNKVTYNLELTIDTYYQ